MRKADEISTPTSCLNKSADDEPLFVLCARDPHASKCVRDWAARYSEGKGKPEKVQEALALADKMDEWRLAQTGAHA